LKTLHEQLKATTLRYRPILAFDEVQDLLVCLDGWIPFGDSVGAPKESVTELAADGSLIRGTCAFSVLVCEASKLKISSILFGTAFSLLETTAKSSLLRENPKFCLDDDHSLLPWDSSVCVGVARLSSVGSCAVYHPLYQSRITAFAELDWKCSSRKGENNHSLSAKFVFVFEVQTKRLCFYGGNN